MGLRNSLEEKPKSSEHKKLNGGLQLGDQPEPAWRSEAGMALQPCPALSLSTPSPPVTECSCPWRLGMTLGDTPLAREPCSEGDSATSCQQATPLVPRAVGSGRRSTTPTTSLLGQVTTHLHPPLALPSLLPCASVLQLRGRNIHIG